MIRTEEEAKTRWCPLARQNEFSRQGDQCMASHCMAWRWARKLNPDWKPDHTMSYPPRDTRNDPPMYIVDTTRGYCGLAGRGDV